MTRYKDEVKGFERFVKSELLKIDKTSRDLAREIGVSDACLSNWLKGYVKLETFKDQIFEALGRLKADKQ